MSIKSAVVICEECGARILTGRLEALPDTKVCIGCSDVLPKTAGDLDLDGLESGGSDGNDGDANSLGRAR